ncbi:hypothetical protein Q9K02_13350 [Qipengyuania sp. G39]|uniref:Restriction endonuclease n=1 Tax=Qipengyuania profundimaris TaxID=3067652 RepID=A0ABT9HTW1_9SPHN|nr:hypothetical protein [Qipengyuania sp. G39]MDP4576123.1 hypothetical protein [Qipengyuania sp. G39]
MRTGFLLHRIARGGYTRNMDADLKSRLMSALFDKPLVTNTFRGTLVEAILAQVLEPEWRWCSADLASHDFENGAGVRLEVKQSAALQSWHEPSLRPNRGRFDIEARTGRYEGLHWIDEPGRAAQIYVFGWHGVADPQRADHREPAQWQFHAVRAADLSDQKTIALSRVGAMAEPCAIGEIAERVRALAA